MNTPSCPEFTEVTGVILAGGLARRMGGNDKGLIAFNGKPLIEYVVTRLQSQVNDILINANRNIRDYEKYGWPVVRDEQPGYNGPLAGMASCLFHVKTPYMVTVPCDSPFLPSNLVSRLYQDLLANDAEICVAHDGMRIQPVFALLKANLRDSILAYLGGGDRKTDLWFLRHRMIISDFSDMSEAFFNINHPQDIEEAGFTPDRMVT